VETENQCIKLVCGGHAITPMVITYQIHLQIQPIILDQLGSHDGRTSVIAVEMVTEAA
jgi:hypothetical protein